MYIYATRIVPIAGYEAAAVTDARATCKVVIEPLSEEDGGGYLATVPELPG